MHRSPMRSWEAAHLNRQFDAILEEASEITPFNSQAKTAERQRLLARFVPRYEIYQTLCKKYGP